MPCAIDDRNGFGPRDGRGGRGYAVAVETGRASSGDGGDGAHLFRGNTERARKPDK
jgi:hypothetical protein